MGHYQHDNDEFDDDVAEEKHGGSGGFLIGALFGGMIGLGAGLLLAPASGESTRHMVRDRVKAARDDAMQKAEQARAKAKELEVNSLEKFEAQKRRVARTAEAVKQSAQEAWSAEDQNGQPMAAEDHRGEMARTSAGTIGAYSPRA